MVLRKLSQVSTSDDNGAPIPSSSDADDDNNITNHLGKVPTGPRRNHNRPRLPEPVSEWRKRNVHIPDDDDDDDDDEVVKLRRNVKGVDDDFEKEKEKEKEKENDEHVVPEDAKPIGEEIRVSGKGRGFKKHFKEFEFDGNRFELEDPVLLTPEDKSQKPYVAIIKDITQSRDGSMMVTGQWFYRPEEAEKNKGGSWQASDTRELFYSFHHDVVPAESVMHKCVVHFIPLNKQVPSRKQFPGFIVRKVYDTVEKKLWKLTDKDYEDGKQEEIDVMVQKTFSRLGELPDVEIDGAAVKSEEQIRSKRLLRKRHLSSLDVSRDDEGAIKSPRMETPGSCLDNASIYTVILAETKSLTKESQRDKWLEKLLQAVEYVCSLANGLQEENKQTNGNNSFTWPESAVSAVVALEKASHEALSSDYSKYNQKLRSLLFNLKNTELLARRLLNGELEPSKILSMQPNELKEGLTQEEIAMNKPEESTKMQMTDARCKRCNEKKVGLVDIIQAGHGDRYQLECVACGNTWYASRDEAAMLTIDGPNSVSNVGTAPLATSKFDSLEKKKALSPRGSDKPVSVLSPRPPCDSDKPVKVLGPCDSDKPAKVVSPRPPCDSDKPAKVLSPRDSDKPVKMLSPRESDRPMRLLTPRDSDKPVKVISPHGSDKPVKVFSFRDSDRPVKVVRPCDSDKPVKVLSPRASDKRTENANLEKKKKVDGPV